MIKTQEITDTSDISDFRSEMQSQVNKITGTASAQERSAAASKSTSSSVSASGGSGGFSAGGSSSNAESRSLQQSQV